MGNSIGVIKGIIHIKNENMRRGFSINNGARRKGQPFSFPSNREFYTYGSVARHLQTQKTFSYVLNLGTITHWIEGIIYHRHD